MRFFNTSHTGVSLIALLAAQEVTSEHVLPKHVPGLWYAKPTYQGVDACGIDFYTYDLATLENWCVGYFKDHSPCKDICDDEEDCRPICGDNTYTIESDSSYPLGFISTNPNDWNTIIQNPTAAKPSIVSIVARTCNTSSHRYEDHYGHYHVRLYPFYDCPDGTRLSHDNVTLEVGCTTTPVPCLADVAGRSALPNDALMSQAGDIALVASSKEPNPLIMEIAHDGATPSIAFNALYGNNSFSSKTYYWGERYQPPSKTDKAPMRMSLSTAWRIIEKGSDQKFYNLTYTFGWGHYPGGTSEHEANCMFRSDTFVEHCYRAAGINIEYGLDPLPLPRTIFYAFQCSANPPEYCSVMVDAQYYNDELDDRAATVSPEALTHTLQHIPDKTQHTTTPALDIFNVIRPMLATKEKQRIYLTALIEKYEASKNIKEQELFARCLCFELKHKQPSDIDTEVKNLLSNMLWRHRHLLDKNFPLAIMNNNLKFFTKKPHCSWLDAFFTVSSETKESKREQMVNYVASEPDVTRKAHFVSASQLSLTIEEKCTYGRLFQKVYHQKPPLSDNKRKLLSLGIAALNTHSLNEEAPVHPSCQSNESDKSMDIILRGP
ncbi:MAG: hypothetical protein NXI01_06480 [Gammaproteobacteria bacterium]|nr:hypothetical protein [Gammaproteobacteria bacterium]